MLANWLALAVCLQTFVMPDEAQTVEYEDAVLQ